MLGGCGVPRVTGACLDAGSVESEASIPTMPTPLLGLLAGLLALVGLGYAVQRRRLA